MVSATQSKPSPAAASKTPANPAPAGQKSAQEKQVERAAKKSAAFKKLATKRMNLTLKVLGRVAALANRNSYAYEPAQADKIVGALRKKVDEIENAFKATGGSSAGFTLD